MSKVSLFSDSTTKSEHLPVDSSGPLQAGTILLDQTTFLGTTLRMLQTPISDVQKKSALLSHYSDVAPEVGPVWRRTITCADRVVTSDQRISEAHELTATITDFLQATTLPQTRKLLYSPHNPIPYVFRTFHMQNVTARLELWSIFPSVIKAITDSLRLFPPAMMKIRQFISDHFCCESSSPADKSGPCHMPGATRSITFPNPIVLLNLPTTS
ncbi:hypothetical protein K438DRAFT_1960113 [Mycena galopus ATCC 62051]|nr:hypothetical protein K438DRAFT_1960113 [Mycena galopus ATCC 62051]